VGSIFRLNDGREAGGQRALEFPWRRRGVGLAELPKLGAGVTQTTARAAPANEANQPTRENACGAAPAER